MRVEKTLSDPKNIKNRVFKIGETMTLPLSTINSKKLTALTVKAIKDKQRLW